MVEVAQHRGGRSPDEIFALTFAPRHRQEAPAGIAVDIIPGVTAAAACAAAAGIPLTHRDAARSLVLTTGHGKPGAQEPDWAALVRPGQTIAFYMGVANAGEIARELLAHGMAASMPVAIIERGATPAQRIHAATLATLGDRIAERAIKAPALLLVGEVAARAVDSGDSAPADSAAA